MGPGRSRDGALWRRRNRQELARATAHGRRVQPDSRSSVTWSRAARCRVPRMIGTTNCSGDSTRSDESLRSNSATSKTCDGFPRVGSEICSLRLRPMGGRADRVLSSTGCQAKALGRSACRHRHGGGHLPRVMKTSGRRRASSSRNPDTARAFDRWSRRSCWRIPLLTGKTTGSGDGGFTVGSNSRLVAPPSQKLEAASGEAPDPDRRISTCEGELCLDRR